MGVIAGRFAHAAWEESGFPPPISADWHYSTKFEPMRWTEADVRHVIDAVPREQYEGCFFIGTLESTADQLQPYLDAGVDWLMPVDLMAFMLPLDQLETSM